MTVEKIKYRIIVDILFEESRTCYVESYSLFKNNFEWTFIEENAETFEDNGRLFYLFARMINLGAGHFENPQMILVKC